MNLYTETTDGSTIEDKETTLVWSYEDADPDFGSCQAKELLDHLESVLANEPVSVKSGQHIVEVKPQVRCHCFYAMLPHGSWMRLLIVMLCLQGVSKGLVARRLLSIMQERGLSSDFVLCIGDDRSDEDMFEVISTSIASTSLTPTTEVFACTVGQKPSKAKYYLDDTAEIVRLMQGLATVSEQALRTQQSLQNGL